MFLIPTIHHHQRITYHPNLPAPEPENIGCLVGSQTAVFKLTIR